MEATVAVLAPEAARFVDGACYTLKLCVELQHGRQMRVPPPEVPLYVVVRRLTPTPVSNVTETVRTATYWNIEVQRYLSQQRNDRATPWPWNVLIHHPEVAMFLARPDNPRHHLLAFQSQAQALFLLADAHHDDYETDAIWDLTDTFDEESVPPVAMVTRFFLTPGPVHSLATVLLSRERRARKRMRGLMSLLEALPKDILQEVHTCLFRPPV